MNPFAGTSRRTCALLFVFTLFAGFSFPVASAQIPSALIHFTDVTEKSGIRFTHFKGNNSISINLEEFSPGVCVSDFDGDGWQDIYFVNGRDRYDRGISVRNASTVTTAMAHSLMSPKKPASPTPVTASAASGATTTTAGPISS